MIFDALQLLILIDFDLNSAFSWNFLTHPTNRWPCLIPKATIFGESVHFTLSLSPPVFAMESTNALYGTFHYTEIGV
jgi:hypothetical protein